MQHIKIWLIVPFFLNFLTSAPAFSQASDSTTAVEAPVATTDNTSPTGVDDTRAPAPTVLDQSTEPAPVAEDGLTADGLSAAAALTTPQAPGDDDPQGGQEAKIDFDLVGSGGEFSTHIDLSIPEYRDLPLPVSFVYDSNDIRRNGVDRTVAFGWSLSAFSVIERRSLGGGIPAWDDGQDLYVLDGEELMACGDASATNPWTRRYPLRYVTDKASASCSAGGTFVTRRDNFARIAYDATANQFTVTNKAGTQFIYKSLAVLTGTTSPYTSNARWLLSEVRDIQPVPNIVTYSYVFGPATDGFPHRIAEIGYAGYRVVFAYTQLSGGPGGEFATGTDTLGKQRHRLSSVQMFDGAAKVRACQLTYAASAQTLTPLLASVREFGNDFALDAAATSVIGGTALPPTTFSYSPDAVAFDLRTYTGTEFHEGTTIVDSNYDGADELRLADGRDTTTETVRCGSECEQQVTTVRHTFTGGFYRFNADRSRVRTH